MHAARAHHMGGVGPTDLYDGSDTGMAASTIARTPLTVQQNVPNMQQVSHAPQTQVIPELEQGQGRAPGWKWAWMRKNIPYSPDHITGHMQRNFGPLRVEMPLGMESVRKLNRPSQTVVEHTGKMAPVTLAAPETAYATVTAPNLPTWGEPL